MRRVLHCALAVPLLLAAAGDRDRIAAERRAVEERYRAGESDCRSRFVVTACVEALQKERRRALSALHQQELHIDDADRRLRADERRRAIEKRRVDVAARPAAPPPSPEPAASQAARPPPAPLVARPRDRSGEAAAAARRASAAERRRDEAAADRERIAEREARRDAKSKKAAPLATLPEPPR